MNTESLYSNRLYRLLYLSALTLVLGMTTKVYSQHSDAVNTKADVSAIYLEKCAACHGRSLQGGVGGGSLSSDAFRQKWTEQGARKLFAFIVSSMPVGSQGSLSRNDYLTVTNDVIRIAELGEQLDPAAADDRGFNQDEVIEMDVDWVSQLPVNNDAIAEAEKKRRAALLNDMKDLSPKMLRLADPGDWLHWRRDYAGTGFSPLKQINSKNVSELNVAWALALPVGTNAITPLVHDGVIFVNSNGTVRAVDAERGDILWEYSRPAERRMQSSQPKSMAIAGSTLLVPTSDVHMLALDMRSGKLVWDHAIEPEGTAYHISSGPLVIRDRVIQGITGCYDASLTGGCFLVALDLKTGREVWRRYSIARPNEPGGDSWNGAPLDERLGGSVWTTASYEPELDLLYIGTSQTYHIATLIEDQKRKGKSADALYTNSTLALDPDTGNIVWHFQHFPGDLWDLDWAFERTLVDLEVMGRKRRAVITMGKIGILDALDAKTGQYLFSMDTGAQNLVAGIDPLSGRKIPRADARPRRDSKVFVCPSSLGVRNWPATATDPERGIVFTPVSTPCMDIIYEPGKGVDSGWIHRPHPDSDGMIGGVYGVDLKSRRIVWKHRRRATGSGAILATAGGLVFEGARDRWFRAFDSGSGKVLWDIRLDGVPSSFPVSFAVAGRQYIAVTAGGGNVHDTFWRPFSPEINSPPDATTLWVFSLD